MQLHPQFLVLLASLISLAPSSVKGECCPADRGWCDDSTEGTPCCAYAKCNIFCCNCDGGCRTSLANRLHQNHGQVKESHTGNDEHSCSVAFAQADLNDDRVITFGEWVTSQTVEGGSAKALTEHWLKFDWEDKGYLTFKEAYERKA